MNITVPDNLAPVVPALMAFLSAASARLSAPAVEASVTQPQFEVSLRAETMALERSVHSTDLARFDVDVPGLVFEGKPYRRCGQSVLEVLTTAGAIEVVRTLYRGRGAEDGHSTGALELRLGLIDGRSTLAAAKLVTQFTTYLTPKDAVDALAATGTMTLSRSTADRLNKVVNERWELRRAEFEEAVRLAELMSSAKFDDVATIAMSLDGVMVRMKDAPNTPGSCKEDPGPHGHREAATTTVSIHDSAGTRLCTRGYARMPESKKVTLRDQLLAEMRAMLDLYPGAKVVALADAAKENWRILSEVAKELGITIIKVTDFCHAAEHLSDGLKAAGWNSAKIEIWRTRLLEEVGGAEACLAELARLNAQRCRRSAAKRLALADELTYFTNNSDHMKYAEYRAQNLPIATGVEEASCKTYVGERLKRSGMSWRTPGGQGVLTMRAMRISGRFDHGWAALMPTLRTPVNIDTEARPVKTRAKAA